MVLDLLVYSRTTLPITFNIFVQLLECRDVRIVAIITELVFESTD